RSALRDRHICLGARLGLETALIHVADDADDGAVAVDADLASDGTLAREILPRGRLVDDDDLRRALTIGGLEQAAFAQGNADGCVIVGRHAADADARIRALERAAGNRDARDAHAAAHRHAA